MINRITKLRWRRRIRRSRKNVEVIGVQAEEHIEQHFFKRLTRLFEVRRFLAGWVLLLILLAGGVTIQLRALTNYYQELAPAPGGTYSEGMIGSFTNASPLYASGLVDVTVSRLVFAGLLKYDSNNSLIGDLAESWKVSPDGKLYTVLLRPNLKWHDGKTVTSEDVAYTFQTIQNPDAKSPLYHGWRGVVIKPVDPRTITFTLPNPLAPFAYALTTGIVPKHILGNIEYAQLRSSPFNTSRPIGAGPFKWETIETLANSSSTNLQQIGLARYGDYHKGQPNIQRFVIKTYENNNQLIDGFQRQDIDSLVGLDRLPDSMTKSKDIVEHTAPLTAQTMAFLRTDSEVLADVKVRQALVHSINVPAVVGALKYPTIIADEPLLRGQAGYNPALRQLPFNVEAANKLLDEAGWKRLPNETVRSKGAAKLSLKFLAQNNSDYVAITQQLQKAWQAVGAEAAVTLLSDSDLQPVVNGRGYDVLLYGISLGVDPDVFAYWHSSQADPRAASRLNLSNYKSTPADKALEAGRNRIDPSLRAAKYVPFLQSWRNDAPAIALYQPRFLYITRNQLYGFEPKAINTAADRFNNVENWMIREDYKLKTK